MFDGLYSYECVLMVLGIILFLVLTAGLVVFIVQKRGLAALLAFYSLPLLMIGFPAFEKISYDNGVLTLEKESHRFQQDPNDSAARAAVQAGISKVEARAGSNPKANLALARAYRSLDQPERALTHVDAVLKVSPQLEEAVRLRSEVSRDVVRRPPVTTRPP